MKERTSSSLTEGPITKSILFFTGPLIIGFIIGLTTGAGIIIAG